MTATLVPTSIVSSSGLTGATVGNLSADDGTYATAASNSTSGSVRVGFDTPSGNPITGAGLQTFNAKCCKRGGSSTPTARLELWESGGGSALAVGSETNVSATSPDTTITLAWDASLLGTASGADVEARLVFTSASGGSGDSSVDIDYIEWVADTAATFTITADVGAFALTGSDAGLSFSDVKSIMAESASFALAGADTSLLAARILGADGGSFSLAGTDTEMRHIAIADILRGRRRRRKIVDYGHPILSNVRR